MLILLLACNGDGPAFGNIGNGRCSSDEERLFFEDRDGDGFGGTVEVWACERPEGASERSGDCNDEVRSVNPDQAETCATQRDDNCDGVVDDGQDGDTYYRDEDGDGFGEEPLIACSWPEGYATLDGDCDDTNAEVNPRIDEVCNEVDDDCDGQVDEFVGGFYYTDDDGDGWGTGQALDLCDPPDNVAEKGGDCDDGDPALTKRGLYFDGELQDIEDGGSWAFPGDGTLQVCKGTWNIQIEATDVIGSIEGVGGVQDTILTGGRSARPLTVSGGEVSLSGLTVLDGDGEEGGCIQVQDAVFTLDGATVRDCTADSGAGLFFRNSTATLGNSGVRNNAADAEGGAIYAEGSELTLSNTIFSASRAAVGGGLYIGTDSVVVQGAGEVQECSSTDGGGGIAVVGGSWSGSNVTLRNNSSQGPGGGIYAQDAELAMATGKLKANSSQEGGGAMLDGGASLVLTSVNCGNEGADDNGPNDVSTLNGGAFSWDGTCTATCDQDGCVEE